MPRTARAMLSGVSGMGFTIGFSMGRPLCFGMAHAGTLSNLLCYSRTFQSIMTTLMGVASRWFWGDDPSNLDHWKTSACRAWALLSVPVIAHELGHCFGLAHNEDDGDGALDLMKSHYTHFDWVKLSNKQIVWNHFEGTVPDILLQSSPQMAPLQF